MTRSQTRKSRPSCPGSVATATDKRVGPWVGEDFEEAADLIERLHRRVAKLEKDIEAAYAEQKEGSP